MAARKTEFFQLAEEKFGREVASRLRTRMAGEEALNYRVSGSANPSEILAQHAKRISEREERLEELSGSFGSNSMQDAASVPWLTSTTPKEMKKEVLQLKYLNDLCLRDLELDYGAHLAVEAMCSRMLDTLAARVDPALNGLPKNVSAMLTKLASFGLTARQCQAIGVSELEAIAEYIKDRKGPAGEAALRRLLDRMGAFEDASISDEAECLPADELGNSLPSSDGLDAQLPPNTRAFEPRVPQDLEALVNRESGHVEPEYWSGLQSFAAPFAWQYRESRDDDYDRELLSFPLPKLLDLATAFDALPAHRQRGLGIPPDKWLDLEDMLVFIGEMDGVPLTEEKEKFWLLQWCFLLFGHKLRGPELEKYAGRERFDGLDFRCPMNPRHVRTLRYTGA